MVVSEAPPSSVQPAVTNPPDDGCGTTYPHRLALPSTETRVLPFFLWGSALHRPSPYVEGLHFLSARRRCRSPANELKTVMARAGESTVPAR